MDKNELEDFNSKLQDVRSNALEAQSNFNREMYVLSSLYYSNEINSDTLVDQLGKAIECYEKIKKYQPLKASVNFIY